MKNIVLLISIVTAFLMGACNLEKEVDIELPTYDSQLVVESYLQPDEFYTLLLTRSSSYFEPFPTSNDQFLENLLVSDAEVTITVDGKVVVLENRIYFDLFTGKLFNYISNQKVPADYDHEFQLNIDMADGKSATASTFILPPVPIDSVVIEFSETTDTLARILTYATDDTGTDNFYRRMAHRGTLDSLEQDLVINDRLLDNELLVFGSGYDYVEGDTLINTLYHITEEYHDFNNSVENAVNANGNPFAQPSSIISNIQGDAIGIFTGFSGTRETVVIEK